MDTAAATAAPFAPGVTERSLDGAMADLMARVDAIGQSVNEAGKEAYNYWSGMPSAALPIAPSLPLLPLAFQILRKAATLPFAPIEYATGTTLPVVVAPQTIPSAPLSEIPGLPKHLDQLNKR